MSELLNFGNGYIAGGSSRDAVRIITHSGLDYPVVELSIRENTVLGGGIVGPSRAGTRQMSVRMEFDNATRQEVAAAFSPGVERTLTGVVSGASMPYYVSDVLFGSSNLVATTVATVVIVSPYAYPLGALLTAAIDSGYTATAINAQQLTQDATYASAGYEDRYGQTFALQGGERVEGFTFYTGANVTDVYVGIYATIGGIPVGSPLYLNARTVTANAEHYAPLSYQNGAAGTFCIMVWSDSAAPLDLRYNSAGGYASGTAVRVVKTVGYGDDTNLGTSGTLNMSSNNALATDLYFKLHTQRLVTDVTFDADTDVTADCVITMTMVVAASSLVVTDGTRTATLTGELVAGDVVVIDSSAYTVTVNGVNKLSWFDRTGDWPRVSPGSNTFTVTPSAATSIAWYPRFMGLI